MKMRCGTRNQAGLSLIELMVSVAMSAAIVSSLVFAYVGSRGAYRNNEAVARVQERGRFALEWIARDLRQAGYMGCLSRGSQITFYSNPKPVTLPSGGALFGYEFPPGDQSEFDVGSAKVKRVGGDVVLIQYIDVRQQALVTEDTDVVNANIKVNANPGFQKGEFLVVTDCERAAVFTLTNTQPANTLTHGGDANGKLDTPDHRISPAFRKSARAFVARFGNRPTGYFIDNNPAGYPTLYRLKEAGGTLSSEPVVDHIEDLDFLYGVDADNDGAVDTFKKADAVTSSGQWDQVLSVRVSLVATSGELTVQTVKGDKAALRPGQGAQALYLRDEDGDTVVDQAKTASDDRQLRQVFSTTVALRNRLP